MAEKAFPGIRPFKSEDINKILEIEKQAFPKTPYPKETFLEYTKIFPDNFIVMEIGEDIAGYIIFHMDGHILSTAVKPEYRRKGFGKMLFMHALKVAESELWLEVRSKNGGAIEFYKKLGMEIVGKIPNYYGSDDALIMDMSRKTRIINSL
jgi:ribosomal-protein-alanine N-acetyltransferase